MGRNENMSQYTEVEFFIPEYKTSTNPNFVKDIVAY